MNETELLKSLADDVTANHNNVADCALLFIDGNISKDELASAVKDWKHACEVYARECRKVATNEKGDNQ